MTSPGCAPPWSRWSPTRRHAVTVRSADINLSLTHATLEPVEPGGETRVVRLGLGQVRTIGAGLTARIVTEHETNGPYASMVDLARRTRMTTPQLEALATEGAFTGFDTGWGSAWPAC